jgi:hypothetical protein
LSKQSGERSPSLGAGWHCGVDFHDSSWAFSPTPTSEAFCDKRAQITNSGTSNCNTGLPGMATQARGTGHPHREAAHVADDPPQEYGICAVIT